MVRALPDVYIIIMDNLKHDGFETEICFWTITLISDTRITNFMYEQKNLFFYLLYYNYHVRFSNVYLNLEFGSIYFIVLNVPKTSVLRENGG